jgi:hypothetical protein
MSWRSNLTLSVVFNYCRGATFVNRCIPLLTGSMSRLGQARLWPPG